MADVQSIDVVAALLEDLRPVVEKHDLRLSLRVGQPQEPMLVLMHREHGDIAVCFRDFHWPFEPHADKKGIEIVHYDLQHVDHHELLKYDPEKKQSVASAVRIAAISISIIYSYVFA